MSSESKNKTIIDELQERLDSMTLKPNQKYIHGCNWNNIKREPNKVYLDLKF